MSPHVSIPSAALPVLLPLLMIAACETAPAPRGVIARVGDAVLTEADLEARLPFGLDRELVAAEREQLIENWVQQELLYQEALQRKLHQDARVQSLLDQARRDVLAAALLDQEFAGQEVATDERTIQEYYEQHAEEFQRARPEIRARHILLASRRDANAKWQLLQRGEPFAEVVKHSLDEDTRFDSGDLGYFSEDQDPLLWAACKNLPLNRVSKPVRTEYGYHIIQVLDRQEAGTIRDLEQVRSHILEALVRQQYEERLAQLVARLKNAHDWAVTEPALADTL